MTSSYATVSIQDLEALMLAASVVRGVYAAVDAHKQDAAVMRTRDDVAQAISNASRMIGEARRVKDPMEDEPATGFELACLRDIRSAHVRQTNIDLDPRSPWAIDLIRKKLAVMGHMTATIHWGDKTTETRASDKLVWKCTAKGEAALKEAGMFLEIESK